MLKKIFNVFKKENSSDEIKIINGVIVCPGEEQLAVTIQSEPVQSVVNNQEIKITQTEEKPFELIQSVRSEPEQFEVLKENHDIIIENDDVSREISSEQQENSQIELIPGMKAMKGRPKNLDGFYLTLQAAGRSAKTIENYKYDMKYWNQIAQKYNKSIYRLKLKEIEMAIAGRDINTVRRLISSLKQLGKWYLRDGYPLLHLELQKVILGRGKTRIPKAKGENEFRNIRDEAKQMCLQGDRKGVWLALMIMCGLRISEIQTAEPGDKWIQVIGKGNKERRIPCPSWILETMKTLPKKSRGGYQKKRQYVDKLLRESGYSKFHSLRHTYATTLLLRGKTIESIQNLLGHSSIATTQIYTKVKIEEDINEILEK